MYPDETIQSLVRPWWAVDRAEPLARGRLVYAYVLHADGSPFVLTPEGKKEPADPARVRMRIEPVRAAEPPRAPSPPAPALPLDAGEAWCVRRGRRRACIVVSVAGPDVRRPLRTSTVPDLVGPALTIAPYYDAAGLDPAFVARVRRAEYPQYVWDRLPFPGGGEVILRLDQLQPHGRDPLGLEWTDHALSPAALAVLDHWLCWALTGALAPGDLRDFRELARGE